MPNEREAALQAVKTIGAEPIMSEYTINAQNANSVQTCLDKVKSSNIYVLILGGVYGCDLSLLPVVCSNYRSIAVLR